MAAWIKMESKLAKIKQDNIVEICRRMKPEERLVAFLNHSKLVSQIYQAGVDFRAYSKKDLNLSIGISKSKKRKEQL